MSSTTEPVGANCAAGGERIDFGRDANGNNVLETTEVEATRFICHGIQGDKGDPGDPAPARSESEIEGLITNGAIDLATGSSVGGRFLVGQATPCAQGDLLLFDLVSGAWVCGQDQDTTLSADQVKTILTQHAVDLAAGSTRNGQPLLDMSSTLPYENIDTSGAGTGDVLRYDGSAVGWTAAPIGLDGFACQSGEIFTRAGTTWECTPFESVIDADGDNSLTWNDCDDGDAALGNISADGDCDGILTQDDCDDGDSQSTRVSEDGDCDGRVTANDCDDADPNQMDVDGQSAVCAGTSCKAILDAGFSSGDGVYWVNPDGGAPYQVYCDMTNHGGGWTLLAKFSPSGSSWSWNDANWSSSSTFNVGDTLNQTSDSDARGEGWYRSAGSSLRMTTANTSSGPYVVFPNVHGSASALMAAGTQSITPSEGDIRGFTKRDSGFQGDSGSVNNIVTVNNVTGHSSGYGCCSLTNRVRLGALSFQAFSAYPNGGSNTGFVGIGGTTVYRDGHEASCCNYSAQSESYSNTSGDLFILWGR